MNITVIKNAALALALTATVFGAKAQKVYTEGTITYNISVAGNSVDALSAFKGDSSSLSFQQGPAQIKMVSSEKNGFFAVLVDVPVANRKMAAVGTPAEIEEAMSMEPQYAFTKTEETKKIGDYNCIKYQSKDTKSGIVYDLWITKDITVPPNMINKYYTSLGTPVMFTYLQGGSDKGAQVVTLKSISDAKLPAGAFAVPADYTKISLTDLQNMSRGRH
ncbi:hypothetical protein [Mucilaginibacter paludis]|uniref:DUF4412 domain-containing protein n=1 Tax=Mucilaginibacter paludis DSM 18603 TaxID=714943 RepID=H1YDE0_9SPHI|nr:hypothetical protein [Mucilaginibacter paludis]EHQ30149.1 hypothetical protein Mucpa_6091 [Mucilaginibacter paludis DSM 18603]